jgi:ribosomal protein S18 acetylase RimI-like enzyme
VKKVFIRGYKDKDREECRALWGELTQWHRDIYDDSGIGGANPGLHFDEHLKKVGHRQLIVASVGSKVVGLVGYMDGEEEFEVEPLIVSRDCRGKGIGTMLLNEVRKRVQKQKGVKYLSVRPVARNERAIEYFRSRGFDKIGRIELFIDFSGREWKKDMSLFERQFEY